MGLSPVSSRRKKASWAMAPLPGFQSQPALPSRRLCGVATGKPALSNEGTEPRWHGGD